MFVLRQQTRRLAVFGFALILTACGQEALPPLVASNIEISTAMPGHSMSAGYLVLSNNTDDTIVIDGVTSPDFGAIEIHESTLEDGVAKMRRIPELSIAPHSTLTLARGGKHLMLMQRTGNNDQIALNFMLGDTILLGVSVPLNGGSN